MNIKVNIANAKVVFSTKNVSDKIKSNMIKNDSCGEFYYRT